MFKKFLVMAVTAAVLVGITSCGGKNSTDGEGAVTVSMLYMDSGVTPYKSDWLVFQEIAKRKNVKLDLLIVPGSDYNQKRAMVMASGDIPDLLVNMWAGEIGQYAKDGILLPVSDYIDKLPNLEKLISDWGLEESIENIREENGKFYIMPTVKKEIPGSNVFMIRQDIFDELGINTPETYDDLLDAMIRIKQARPDSLGTGELYMGQEIMSFLAGGFDTNGGFSLPWGYAYNSETGEWYFAPTSQEYFTMLSFLNKMYNAGCLDPEAFTQDHNMYNSKVYTAKYAVVPGTGPQAAVKLERDIREKGGDANAKITPLYPLAGPSGTRKTKPNSKVQGGIALPSTVAKRKDLDKILDFCDWLYYSEEGCLMTLAGVEGVTYDVTDGKITLKPDIKTPVNPMANIAIDKEYGFGQWGFKTLAEDLLPMEVAEQIKGKEQIDFDKYLVEHDMVKNDDPIIKFTAAQSEKTKLLISTLNDYCNSMKMKFIFGQESFDKWDSYIKECKSKGSDELMNTVITAWKENNKK